MNIKVPRALSLLVLADGLVTATLGHDFLAWLAGVLPSPLKPGATLFLKWPEPLLRAGALLQASVGLWLWYQDD